MPPTGPLAAEAVATNRRHGDYCARGFVGDAEEMAGAEAG
jgi:hypothetical protein